MTYEEITVQVAGKIGLPVRLVDRTYKAYWKAVREHIATLPLKENLTDEEFLKLQPNVNIPSIGKLHVTLERYHGMKKRFERYKEYYKGNKYKKNKNAEDNKD